MAWIGIEPLQEITALILVPRSGRKAIELQLRIAAVLILLFLSIGGSWVVLKDYQSDVAVPVRFPLYFVCQRVDFMLPVFPAVAD